MAEPGEHHAFARTKIKERGGGLAFRTHRTGRAHRYGSGRSSPEVDAARYLSLILGGWGDPAMNLIRDAPASAIIISFRGEHQIASAGYCL